MTLEAQLLQIIEEQQHQLKQQQEQQQQAFQLIQQQGRTINELENYTAILREKHSEAVQVVKRYQTIVKQLSEQTIPPHFSDSLQRDLQQQLEKRLTALVDCLNIEQQITKALPRLPNRWRSAPAAAWAQRRRVRTAGTTPNRPPARR